MIIELENVTKTYKLGVTKIVALDNINLKIEEGEFLSVMGPSGCGKSTLLNIIGCIDTPTSGRVFLKGRDVSKLSEKELTKIRLRNIGFIFQQFYLIPTLTAFENVELPMKEAGVGKGERRERTISLLEKVGLKDRQKHHPNQLSGGEQQRVAIARAIANNPSILLADEPTGEVDSETCKKIIDLLRVLNDENKITILIVTHDPKVANETRRKITLLDGRIVE
ncbi:MAG: ABC transporter ATP-binding protein [Candidatus Thermoplasmatota archaeon]